MWLAKELQHSLIAFIYPFACRSAISDDCLMMRQFLVAHLQLRL